MPTNGNLPATSEAQLPDAANRIADLLGGLGNIQNSIAEAGGVASTSPFLSITNDGYWAYGQDRTEVEPGSHWAVDIRTWKHGYIAWPDQKAKERKPLGERMVPASMALPVLASLPDVGQPYSLQFAFDLLCVSGEDTGTVVLYKNGSYGCKVIMQDLVEKVRAQSKIDPSRLCPVVVLDIRSYEHKEWKKTVYNPVLQIQKWISFAEFEGFAPVTPIAGPDTPDASSEAAAAAAAEAEAAAAAEAEAEAAAEAAEAAAAAKPASRRTAAPAPEVAARGTGRRAPAPAPAPARRTPGRRTQPSA